MNNKLAANLIEAIQIFDKYMVDGQYFTHCEHDTLYVCVEADQVSNADKDRLDELGFTPNDDGIFHSWRYGSC